MSKPLKTIGEILFKRFFMESFNTENDMIAAINGKEYKNCKLVNFQFLQHADGNPWVALFERKR